MKTIFIEVSADDYYTMMDEVKELVEVNGDYDALEVKRVNKVWTATLYYEQHETEIPEYESTKIIH